MNHTYNTNTNNNDHNIIFAMLRQWMCESTGLSADACEDALCWRSCFQGFHFEAKMDACAHFLLKPLCPYLGSYIILVNTGVAAGPCDGYVTDDASAKRKDLNVLVRMCNNRQQGRNKTKKNLHS